VNEDCLKLTVYFGERQRTGGRFFADVLLDLCARRQVAISLLMRGAEGFGLRHHLRTDRVLTLSEDLPLTVVAVDARPTIGALLDDLRHIDHRGLLTLERVRMLTADIGPVSLPEELHEATKLTVYVGRRERADGMPAFIAICELLHRRGVAGASVLLGVDGTRHGRRERARFFASNADVPVMIIAVGSGDRIASVLPELGGLLRHPLITLERVRICKQAGQLIARPHALPGRDNDGRQLWQKLMIYTSDRTTHHCQPIHRELVRLLRRDGAAGATVLRGIWGFHGDRRPHGDRLFQLRRSVPVVTVIIDTPERTGRWFTLVDELTAEHGVVTSELVPALQVATTTERRGSLRMGRHFF